MNKSFLMTRLALLMIFACLTITVQAQGAKTDRKSPPAKVNAKINGVTVSIDYSQPSKRDRLIWGGVVKYGKVWRTGANETTVFKLSASAKINGQLLKEGSYSLFTIPDKDKWTIIFNSAPQQWGAFTYDEAKDVLRVDVTPSYGNPSVEQFTIDIDDKGNVTLKWDDAVVSFKVS